MSEDATRVVGYVSALHADDARIQEARLREHGAEILFTQMDRRDRSALARMLGEIRPGDVLLVVSLDRLGRSLDELIHALNGTLGAGATIRTLDGSVDLSSAEGGGYQRRLLDTLISCPKVWRKERASTLSETMASGGRAPGAPAKLSSVSRGEIDDLLRAPGATRKSVAKQLGIGRTTLYRFLTSRQEAG